MDSNTSLQPIPSEKIVLHTNENKIIGYTSIGSYDMNSSNQPLVSKEILPPNFFVEFDSGKFVYQDCPTVKVSDNPDYQPPQPVETVDNSYSESATNVSLKEYNELKNELSDIKTMIYNLTDILTKGDK
nr:tail fiber protein [Staphylococcus phage S-CoN_Ph38]